MSAWEKGKAVALKILGSEGKVPDIPNALDKADGDFENASNAFEKSRYVVYQKIQALQNSNDLWAKVLKQYLAKVEASDLGLDPKNKDDAKKIKEAKAVLTDALKMLMKHFADRANKLGELNKHIEELGNYKQKRSSV